MNPCSECGANLDNIEHYPGCIKSSTPKSNSTHQTGRTTFATGATRDEKVAGETNFPLRYDLLLSNTEFLRRMAATYGEGAQKYGDDNWRNGMPEKSVINHMMAHIVQHLEGDITEDHLAHATWNLITLMWVQVNKPHLMDLTALTAKGKLQPCNTSAPQRAEDPWPSANEIRNMGIHVLKHGVDMSDDAVRHCGRAINKPETMTPSGVEILKQWVKDHPYTPADDEGGVPSFTSR